MAMRMCVAGAAGFIGYHLTQRLLSEGHEVVGIDNYVSGQRRHAAELSQLPRFTMLEADIAEPLHVQGAIDVIFNMACPASPVDFRDKSIEIMRTCARGVEHLLELARRGGAVFVQASTSECYGDPLEHPQRESYWGHVNPIGPRSMYDEGKRYAEALTMAYHRRLAMRTRIVRIFNTYGPRMRADDGRALPTFISQALKGEPLTIHGDGTQTRSFCYVSDLVEGIIRLSMSDYAEPVNIGNDEEVTIGTVAQQVIDLAGSRSTIRCVPRPGDDPERRRPDLACAKRVLDWRPTIARAKGLAETIRYFRGLMPAGPGTRPEPGG